MGQHAGVIAHLLGIRSHKPSFAMDQKFWESVVRFDDRNDTVRVCFDECAAIRLPGCTGLVNQCIDLAVKLCYRNGVARPCTHVEGGRRRSDGLSSLWPIP